MLPIEALRSIRPMWATPCYGFNVTAPYSASMFTLASHAAKIGMESLLEHGGDSLIPRGRNRLVSRFLAGDCTHLFFIDADVQFTSSAAFRLLLADRDVAVGIYPLKQIEASYPFFPVGRDGSSDADGFAEVYPATTGFMCIKRDVITKMIAAYPERSYEPDAPDEQEHYDLFPPIIEPATRRYWSEDYGFCHLWHEIGGKVWGDVHSKLSHYGQHLFHGDLAAHLKRGPAVA